MQKLNPISSVVLRDRKLLTNTSLPLPRICNHPICIQMYLSKTVAWYSLNNNKIIQSTHGVFLFFFSIRSAVKQLYSLNPIKTIGFLEMSF